MTERRPSRVRRGNALRSLIDRIDATAAGDAFAGALAVALAEGNDLIDAVSFANAAGALATTRRGAQPSLPSRAEVDALLTAGRTAP